MLHGFYNSIVRLSTQGSLVNRVADYKHVIDTDSNKQERHQTVYTSCLASQSEADAKARSIGKTNTEEAH